MRPRAAGGFFCLRDHAPFAETQEEQPVTWGSQYHYMGNEDDGGRRGDPTYHLLWDPFTGFLDFVEPRGYHNLCAFRHGLFQQECQARDQAELARENARDYSRLKALHDIDMMEKDLGLKDLELLGSDEAALDDAQLSAMIEGFNRAARGVTGNNDFANAMEKISSSPAEGTGTVGEYVTSPSGTDEGDLISRPGSGDDPSFGEAYKWQAKGCGKLLLGGQILAVTYGLVALHPWVGLLYAASAAAQAGIDEGAVFGFKMMVEGFTDTGHSARLYLEWWGAQKGGGNHVPAGLITPYPPYRCHSKLPNSCEDEFK